MLRGRAAGALAGVLALSVLAAGAVLVRAQLRDDGALVGASTGLSMGGEFTTLPQAEVERDLDAVRDSGARWVRVDVNWALVERTRGRPVWDDVDRVVDAARARDLRVLGLLAYTPDWARPGCDSDKCPPADPAAFAAFATAAAQRYALDRVAAWELWNEPNVPSFWAPVPDPARYGELLRVTTAALRAVRPDAVLVSGGLAPADGSGGSVRPVNYLERLYDTGALPGVDAVGWHPYSGTALPLQEGTEAWNAFLQLERARQVMVQRGDAATTIWGTEFGVSTASDPRGTSPEQQAAVVRQALRRLGDRTWPWLETLFVYRLRDISRADDWQSRYGVLEHDGTAKPAFGALREQARRPVAPDAGGTPQAPGR